MGLVVGVGKSGIKWRSCDHHCFTLVLEKNTQVNLDPGFLSQPVLPKSPNPGIWIPLMSYLCPHLTPKVLLTLAVSPSLQICHSPNKLPVCFPQSVQHAVDSPEEWPGGQRHLIWHLPCDSLSFLNPIAQAYFYYGLSRVKNPILLQADCLNSGILHFPC